MFNRFQLTLIEMADSLFFTILQGLFVFASQTIYGQKTKDFSMLSDDTKFWNFEITNNAQSYTTFVFVFFVAVLNIPFLLFR